MDLSQELSVKAERIAELKTKIKVMEEEARTLGAELIEAGVACDIDVSTGKLSFSVRENYAIKTQELIKEMTQALYIQYATISKTNVVKAIGEAGFQKCKDRGIISTKSISEFFTFRAKKK